MPTRKLYIEFDEPVAQGAAIAARFNGMSLSAWINEVTRYALDEGYFDVEEEVSRPRLERLDVSDIGVNGWLEAPEGEIEADIVDPTAETMRPADDSADDADDDPTSDLDDQQLMWADAQPAEGRDDQPAPPASGTKAKTTRPKKKSAAKKTGARTTGAKTAGKQTAEKKKASAKGTPAKKSPAKKATNKRATKKKSAAKKAAPATKPGSKKTPAKKAPAKKTGASTADRKNDQLDSRLPKNWHNAMRVIEQGGEPSTGAIAADIGISRQAALKLLRAMEGQGVIEWVGTSKRDPNAYWQPGAQ